MGDRQRMGTDLNGSARISAAQNIIAFKREDQQKNELIIVCNFAPVKWDRYRIGVQQSGVYTEVLKQ